MPSLRIQVPARGVAQSPCLYTRQSGRIQSSLEIWMPLLLPLVEGAVVVLEEAWLEIGRQMEKALESGGREK